jgi:hypothetical protein
MKKELNIKKNPKTTSSLINHQRRIHNRFNKEEKEQSNALITSFFKYDEKDLQKLHHAVLEYIIRDLRPLSTINGDGFIIYFVFLTLATNFHLTKPL